MATIKDVAREAGVSPSTVSRTLHDSSLISRENQRKNLAGNEEVKLLPEFCGAKLSK